MNVEEILEDVYLDLAEVVGHLDETSNKKIDEAMTLIAEILENLKQPEEVK